MQLQESQPPLGLIERLGHDGLLENQRSELGVPGQRYTLSSLALFAIMDLVHGHARTFAKLQILRSLAQGPDQAWESVA